MKIKDVLIAEDILEIVAHEVSVIKNTPNREIGDVVKLERLSKVFSVISAATRELVKSGMLGNLKLDESDDTSDSEDDTEDS